MSAYTVYKALSLWQPWGTLMQLGLKRNETRGWETSYRGHLLIHAAKKWNGELERMCVAPPFFDPLVKALGLAAASFPRKSLPFGAILCRVRLVDCVRITPQNAPTGDERLFGDYTPGRFMWITDSLQVFPRPIPMNGAQGLFDVPATLVPGRVAA